MYNDDLVTALKKLGFNVREKKNVTWGQLSKANVKKNVIVVSWMLRGYIGHFSVVDHVTKNSIYLADPESGETIKLQRLVFMRLWFDYEDVWYPIRNSDIQLRWMAVVSNQ